LRSTDLVGGTSLALTGCLLGYELQVRYYGSIGDVVLPVLSFSAFVGGCYLLGRGFTGRTQSAKRICAAVLVVYCSFYILIHLSDGGAFDNCDQNIQAASVDGLVGQSISAPGRAAAFCNSGRFGVFLTRYDVIMLYGIKVKAEQNRVIQALIYSRAQGQRARPIRVYFYEKENWVTWKNESNGASGGSRGPETLLRVAVLN
jgi:hypothetical protein